MLDFNIMGSEREDKNVSCWPLTLMWDNTNCHYSSCQTNSYLITAKQHSKKADLS